MTDLPKECIGRLAALVDEYRRGLDDEHREQFDTLQASEGEDGITYAVIDSDGVPIVDISARRGDQQRHLMRIDGRRIGLCLVGGIPMLAPGVDS